MLACWASVLQPLVAQPHATTRAYEPWRSSGTDPGALRSHPHPDTNPESRQKALSGRDDGRPRAEVTRRVFEELHRSLPGRIAREAGS